MFQQQNWNLNLNPSKAVHRRTAGGASKGQPVNREATESTQTQAQSQKQNRHPFHVHAEAGGLTSVVKTVFWTIFVFPQGWKEFLL